jgi:hypothetical protein
MRCFIPAGGTLVFDEILVGHILMVDETGVLRRTH